MRKRIYIQHGDKGGVGKSLMSALLIDHLLLAGPVTAIEGDGTISDIARRFGGVAHVSGISIDLARPDAALDAIMALFLEIEQAGCPTPIVLNLPASASATLDQHAALMIETAHELGYEIVVAWMHAGDEDSSVLAGRSALCAAADRRVVIVNDRVQGAWTNWRARPERGKWLKSGGLESRLPVLIERAAGVVRAAPGRISDLVGPSAGLPLITRQVIRGWLLACESGPLVVMVGRE